MAAVESIFPKSQQINTFHSNRMCIFETENRLPMKTFPFVLKIWSWILTFNIRSNQKECNERKWPRKSVNSCEKRQKMFAKSFSQIIKNFMSDLFNSRRDSIKALHTCDYRALHRSGFLYDFLLSLAWNRQQSRDPTSTIIAAYKCEKCEIETRL